MKRLEHGQKAFIAAWGRDDSFTIGTVEGYAAENFHLKSSATKTGTAIEAISAAVDRAIKNGHDLAYTINIGKCITDSQGYYERLRAEQAAAIEICAGEIVLIEGREYTVKLMGARYSDPVHFVPLVKQQRNLIDPLPALNLKVKG